LQGRGIMAKMNSEETDAWEREQINALDAFEEQLFLVLIHLNADEQSLRSRARLIVERLQQLIDS